MLYAMNEHQDEIDYAEFRLLNAVRDNPFFEGMNDAAIVKFIREHADEIFKITE